MPLLGGLLSTLFSGLVAFLAQYFTRKVAFGVAAVVAMSGLTLGLFVLFRSLVFALHAYTSGAHSIFIDALTMGIPPAAPFCISTYYTLWTACTVYTWQRDLLHLFVKA
ncbi:DUF5455 family protein [Caenimonas soli]|uniref:DUF5455 family protein n=1 Tax=Caenimonas soli TaxID=2735555 RepID=UPI00155757F6|nr:DUF5455 family protein [Caenimonas soli]NPC57010.1 DUF5455 family protein [Caenimonas soli]